MAYAKVALSGLMLDWQAYVERKRPEADFLNFVSRNISELHDDWKFISCYQIDQLVLYSTHSDPDPVIQNVLNLSTEIGLIIKGCDYGKKYFKREPHRLVSLLLELRKKTDKILNPQTGEALGRFVGDLFGSSFASSLLRFSALPNEYLEGLRRAHVDVDVLTNKLVRIQQYFLRRTSMLSKLNGESSAFITFMASVSAKIASYSFDVWIYRRDIEITKVKAAKLVDLGRRIDPVDPGFMKLLLSFLVDVRARHPHLQHIKDFCDYLLTDSCKCLYEYNKAFQKELRSLVDIYVVITLQGYSSLEEFSGFLAETESMLRDISILYLSVAQDQKPAHDDNLFTSILHKVRILRVELFVREQLCNHDTTLMSVEARSTPLMRMCELRMFAEGLRTPHPNDHDKQYVILTEGMNVMLEPLLQSRTETEIGVNNLLQQVLVKIIFFKAEASLFKILHKFQSRDMELTPLKEDQISHLLEELAELKRLIDTKLIWTLSDVRCTIVELAEMITLLPEDSEEIWLSFAQLSDKVKCIKASALSNVPKTCRRGFIQFLGRNIKELLKYDPPSIAPMKHQLQKVEQQLESLGSLLMKISDLEAVNGELSDHIRQTAHKLEYVVESTEFSDSKYLFWLYDLVEDITAINQQVANISNAVTSENPPQVSRETSSKSTRSELNEVDMVGRADEEEAIIEKLIRGSLQRDVVSIVGMPGLGKTTLARKVSNNKSVMYHFPRRAWCTVSQVYSERELLLDILSGIHGLTDEILKMTDNELQLKARRCLLGNRYLIILDDVWDIGVWNYLQICFPNDRNGSRILITSRLQDLQSAIKPGSDPHRMRLFVGEESWMLLEKKIFREGVSCPEEMLHLGKKIAQHCQGLPLAVVAIAGLLRKTKQTHGLWEKISESLSTQVINDPETRCKEILELSYKHLPEDLKACFLYLGAFLGDKDIPVSKLIQLWIAEGFVQESESKSLEEVAQDYLMELINTSLVIVSKKASNGKVKACRLHDLLRDLCLSKAKDENFLNLVTRDDEPYSSFPAYEYDMVFQNKHRLHPVTFESYRLSIYLRRNHFIDSRPSGPRTRSLIFFASVDKEPRRPYDVSFIGEKFRLLRVLDLECINMGVTFPDEIGLMLQLRYLAVSGYLRSIPPSIAKLWKLQVLVVKGLQGTVVLPESLWSMANLRYLHVNVHVSFDLQGNEKHAGRLDNLVSLSTPSLSFGDDTVDMLRKRLPNIVKMRCMFLESRDSSESSNRFPELDFLTRLESLKIIYYGGAIDSGEFVLPFSLRKLTLSGFRLPWSHVSSIGGLPNLRVLKLLSGAFEGPRWEMKEEEFKELEFLKLEALNIAEWDANYDHLPNLKRLVLRNCNELEEIPQDFAYIPTLEMIEVQWCKKSVEESAERIGNETKEIKVVIAHN